MPCTVLTYSDHPYNRGQFQAQPPYVGAAAKGGVLTAQWLSNSGTALTRAASAAEGMVHALAQPARARRLRAALMSLFLLWILLALVRLVWALVPASTPQSIAPAQVLNPVMSGGSAQIAAQVDIAALRSWHLFGEPGSQETVPVEAEVAPAPGARDGIEEGASETRLDLKLRGVVASTEDGLGYAIIEYKSQQQVYAVEDKLPVPGEVSLAKVMPHRVVLDHGGTYELLTLFEDSSLATQLTPAARSTAAAGDAAQRRHAAAQRIVEKQLDGGAAVLARNYREQLYDNPQSLADVVSVNAVRRDGELLGYRIAPGKEPEQFALLGFEAGDLVTAINGIALDDPASTISLYQTMRTATEATFELERSGQAMSISVQLENNDTAQ